MTDKNSGEESARHPHSPRLRRFQKLSLFAVIFTYLVIFAGGLVRVSGAGLGCPDWPQCFGSWIPPTSVAELPPDIDPAKFNFVLAWIEYINRLGGVLLGFILIWLAFVAWRDFRSRKDILFPALASLALVAFQGWLGSVVVATELEPAIVTLHMLLAILLVSILIYVTHRAYDQPESRSGKTIEKAGLPRLIGLLWILGLVQMLLGTQMREELEVIADAFPLLSGVEQLAQLGGMKHVHTFLGLLVVCATCGVVWYFMQKGIGMTALFKRTAGLTILLVLLQLTLGLGFMTVGMTSLLQLFHLWLASMYIGGVLVMYLEARRTLLR